MSDVFGREPGRQVEGAEELRVAHVPPAGPPDDDAFFPDEIAREDARPAELVESEERAEAPEEPASPEPVEPVGARVVRLPDEPAAEPREPAEDEAQRNAPETATVVAPPEPEAGAGEAASAEPLDAPAPAEHAPGELEIPEGVGVFVGSPNGTRRSVGIAISSFNGDITTRLLEGALAALADAGVDRARVDVMRVPGAFELPLAAMALAKTRRYACVLALGCIIRGDTPHFEYIASEAASGIQLAALETGVPVSFGILTCDSRMQAEARAGGRHGNKGAEAALSGLEMADVFARLRADAVVADRR